MIEKIQIVVNDFKESFENMPLETVGRLTLALFKYANDEDPSDVLAEDSIARVIFPTIKTHIERHEDYRRTKAENGKKGGGQVGNANAKREQPKTTKNDLKRPKTTKNDLKRTPNPNPNPNPFIRDILSCLNENTGKHFKESKETVRLITARLDEGYTVEDFKVVITKKCKEWKNDPKMSTFLRPSTLFAPSHFDEYLNQTEAKEKIVECSKGFSVINRDESEIDFSALEKRLVKNY